ncbi:MAG: hypothetical protein JSR46_12355 [Verrucomicrobia bacterium]|nr:hypothetical protein [Verrucomicrobiota bacterium]
MRNLCIALLLFAASLKAASKYPVDITFLTADLKYSKEHGVKICELQHGILSIFRGDMLLHGGQGLIIPQFEQIFDEFPMRKWAVNPDIAFRALASQLYYSPQWTLHSTPLQIFTDPAFSQAAAIPPQCPESIDSYQGMLFIRGDIPVNYADFYEKCPGIIVTGAPTYPYWIDKYKMSRLFNRDPIVAKVKPEWGLYPKEYSETLAQTIMNDIPADRFVIKPRGAFEGNGVIIVSKEDLDSTLRYILQKSDALKKDKDKSYSHWYKDRFDTFLVEKYYASDEIIVESFEGKTYQPTMRAAFMLIYNNNRIDFRFLAGYWLIPFKSVDEEGSLNELTKAYCKLPYFTKATDEVVKEVEKQLEVSMSRLYQYMLEE